MVSTDRDTFEDLHITRFAFASANVTNPTRVDIGGICHLKGMDVSRMRLWLNTVKTQVKVANMAAVGKCFSEVLTIP